MQSLIVCIDNSEHSRNGDFQPSRLLQQCEAVREVLRVQLNSNPENDIGLIATAGGGNGSSEPEVLLPLSRESVTFMRKLYATQSHGTADPITALRIAQLALKNRKSKRASQRILLFVGSPLQMDKVMTVDVDKEKDKDKEKVKDSSKDLCKIKCVCKDYCKIKCRCKDNKDKKKVMSDDRISKAKDSSKDMSMYASEKEESTDESKGKQLQTLGASLHKASISLDLVILGSDQEIRSIRKSLRPLFIGLGIKNTNVISVQSQQIVSECLLQQLDWLTRAVERSGGAVLSEQAGNVDQELMLAIEMSLQEQGKGKTKEVFVTSKVKSGVSAVKSSKLRTKSGKGSSLSSKESSSCKSGPKSKCNSKVKSGLSALKSNPLQPSTGKNEKFPETSSKDMCKCVSKYKCVCKDYCKEKDDRISKVKSNDSVSRWGSLLKNFGIKMCSKKSSSGIASSKVKSGVSTIKSSKLQNSGSKASLLSSKEYKTSKSEKSTLTASKKSKSRQVKSAASASKSNSLQTSGSKPASGSSTMNSLEAAFVKQINSNHFSTPEKKNSGSTCANVDGSCSSKEMQASTKKIQEMINSKMQSAEKSGASKVMAPSPTLKSSKASKKSKSA